MQNPSQQELRFYSCQCFCINQVQNARVENLYGDHYSTQSNVTLIGKTNKKWNNPNLLHFAEFDGCLLTYFKNRQYLHICAPDLSILQYNFLWPYWWPRECLWFTPRVAIPEIRHDYQWQPPRGLNTNWGYHPSPGNCKSLLSKFLTLADNLRFLCDKNVSLFPMHDLIID